MSQDARDGSELAGREGLTRLRVFRRQTYAFLSSAFKQAPTKEVLVGLNSGGALESITDLFGERLSRDLRTLFEGESDLESLVAGLEREYMNLLRVPGGKYVTPYESVYCDSREVQGQCVRGLLSGQSAIDVKKWYRLARFEIAADYEDLPDHISLELRYLAELCRKEQELEDEGDLKRLERAWEMERDFLAAHPARWIDALATKIEGKTRNPYYLYVAGLARAFVQRDLASLEELLGHSAASSVPDYAAVES